MTPHESNIARSSVGSKRERPRPPQRPTHAGAVVWRGDRGDPLFLLVTARQRHDEWLLPKGHIEPGETPQATARREAREETGLEVTVGDHLGTESFRAKGEEVVCAYYLAHCRAPDAAALATAPAAEETSAAEGRLAVWLPHRAALKRSSFPAGRAMLARAGDLLTSR